MRVKFLPWVPDEDVCGDAAALAIGDRVLDLVITLASDTTVPWDVVDGFTIIACGVARTIPEAKHAAETAGRRALLQVA